MTDAAVELHAKLKVGQDSAEAYGHFVVKNTASSEAYAHLIVRNVSSTNAYAHLIVRNVSSANAYAHFIVRNVSSAELSSKFRVSCPRRMGGNWQRKMWFDGTYYWRGRYDPAPADEIIFEYIAAASLAGTWTKNANASIDCSGFAADWIIADFTVRGAESGIKTTIHYSDGTDTWVAESNEASLTGWAWQNLTKAFDAVDAGDSYRRVNLGANRKTPLQRLWVSAVFIDDDAGKQWVKASQQKNVGSILVWDTPEDVSDTNNSNTIYGSTERSMGVTGAERDDMLFVWKEGDALKSRYYTGAAWAAQGIQNIDTTTYSGKAMFDFEHGETLGEEEGHVVYVDADGSVKWKERDAGAGEVWSVTAEVLDSGTTGHGGVGIVEHGSGWLWAIWREANVLQYRVHLCGPEIWYPLLVSEPFTFDVSSEAVVTTSTVCQPNTPDRIPSGEAVPICWVGETAPATPCAVGWGILVEYSIASLKGVFNVRQLTSVDLDASIEVGQDSADLLGKAEIQQSGSADAYARIIVRNIGSADA